MLEELYFKPDSTRYETLDDIFERMICSAMNRQSMPNVIGYWGKNRSVIQEVIGEPNVALVANMGHDELYAALHEKVGFKNFESKRNLWRTWSRSVVDCARFLAPFEDRDGFYSFADELALSDSVSESALPYLRLALPMMIKNKVHGMGFALACDFLKELGYECYPKPDVHLKEVFCELGLASSKDDYEVFEAIVRVARNAGVTPYCLDKTVWLICSGNFYSVGHWVGDSVGSHKEEFLARAKTQIVS